MTVTEAKKQYNELLKRYYKAGEYFEREDISNSEKEQFLENFQQVLAGLNYYLGKIEVFTSQEVLEGFQ